jgi:hypothetical protein
MFDKRRDEPSNGAAGSSDIFGTSRKASDKVLATIVRNNTVDEGIIAFTVWLGANGNNNSSTIPIAMKQYRRGINKVELSLRDNILQKDIQIGIVDGVPFCNECRSNDCAHVGFAVCAEQMNVRSRLE